MQEYVFVRASRVSALICSRFSVVGVRGARQRAAVGIAMQLGHV